MIVILQLKALTMIKHSNMSLLTYFQKFRDLINVTMVPRSKEFTVSLTDVLWYPSQLNCQDAKYIYNKKAIAAKRPNAKLSTLVAETDNEVDKDSSDAQEAYILGKVIENNPEIEDDEEEENEIDNVSEVLPQKLTPYTGLNIYWLLIISI